MPSVVPTSAALATQSATIEQRPPSAVLQPGLLRRPGGPAALSVPATGDMTAARVVEVAPVGAVPRSVASLHYSIAPQADIQRMSVLGCRRVIGQKAFGVNDPRLGVCNKVDKCATCGLSSEDCVGHAGHITLPLPVFHPGMFPALIRVVRTICKRCSHVLLTDEEKQFYCRRFLTGKLDPLQTSALTKAVAADAAKVRVCSHCGSLNGTVRRLRPMRLVHEKYQAGILRRGETADDGPDQVQTLVATALTQNPEVGAAVSHLQDFLDPLRVRQLLAAVPPSDVPLLGMRPGVQPADLIVSTLSVPPVAARPSGPAQTGGTREDELTVQYQDILLECDTIRAVAGGTSAAALAAATAALEPSKLAEHWDQLQMRVARLMDAALPGYPATLKPPMIKSFAQRIKGKHGRFRGHLSGKRVNFSGRSVISPDPNLAIDELAIPLRVALKLTYSQRVSDGNLALMRRLVLNGPDRHPGACFVLLKDGTKKNLHFDREAVAAQLTVGDIVERHCMDGDLMIFNRQPSLHRISMMCHRARVLPHRTLRFNVCCCAPYNADFDGDEMNIHLVQTEEARAEVKTLLRTTKNLITARNGEPIIAATQDLLTASFLLTARDVFLDRAQFSQVIAHWQRDIGDLPNLPPPTILKPVELWTGKQVYDVILNPRGESVGPVKAQSEMTAAELLQHVPVVSFATGNKSYSKPHRHNCPNEGFVAVANSHLISGRLDKKLLGGGAKDGLFANLISACGGDRTATIMNRIARCTTRWLMNYGFSLGLGDVSATKELEQRKADILSKYFGRCDDLIRQAKEGRLQPVPGMTVAGTLEAKLNGELSEVRSQCGDAAVQLLGSHNAPNIMALSGSKGSPLNIAQMMACVGQQTVNGKRIRNAFIDRSLPHFPRFAEHPAARGFVANSFYNGLTPTEFWFHTMAGREGLIDTAVKTAETGYIYRRLMKAMEDLSVQYDGTVRNSKKDIVQLDFGEDSLDPVLMEGPDSTPLDFGALWVSVAHTSPPTDIVDRVVKSAKYGAQAAVTDGEYPVSASSSGKGKGYTGPATNSAADEDAPVSEQTAADSQARAIAQALMTPAEVMQLVDAALSTDHGLMGFSSPKFRADIRRFWETKAAELRALRHRHGGLSADGSDDALPVAEPLMARWLAEVLPLTAPRLLFFLAVCARRYRLKRVEPGTSCGAIAAQSVGEPSTQMTLRTFHFAGVASMSITQGVPRLVEVINANKNIATPVVRAPLVLPPPDRHAGEAAQKRAENLAAVGVKSRIERVLLKEIVSHVHECIGPGGAYLEFNMSRSLIEKLQLALTAQAAKEAILLAIKRPMHPLRLLSPTMLTPVDDMTLRVAPVDTGASGRAFAKLRAAQRTLFNLKHVRALLLETPIAGIAGIKRAIVTTPKTGGREILAEGAAFREVMNLPGVDGVRTTCNHVAAIEQVLGIEAARGSIVREIRGVMSAYGLSIDLRHIFLLADVMTHRGVVLGITRYGIQKMNSGVLTMASFERTGEHLYDAAVHQRADTVLSVSESIIVGAPVPLGTNSFGVLLRDSPCGVDTASVTTANTAAVKRSAGARSRTVKAGDAAAAKVLKAADSIIDSFSLTDTAPSVSDLLCGSATVCTDSSIPGLHGGARYAPLLAVVSGAATSAPEDLISAGLGSF